MEYTHEHIDHLITCPKEIIEPPKKEFALEGSHFRNDMKLRSADKKYHFTAFMRLSEIFIENFSIGLTFTPLTGDQNLCLLRCNGPHGPHANSLDDKHFIGYHIHIAKEENIAAGLKSEKYAELTKEFTTYEDALAFFLDKCNVINAGEYFKNLKKEIDDQLGLF